MVYQGGLHKATSTGDSFTSGTAKGEQGAAQTEAGEALGRVEGIHLYLPHINNPRLDQMSN